MNKREKNLNKPLILFVCIFLSAAVIFGAVLGIISGIQNAQAIFSYEGKSFKSGVVNYLSSYYKYNYLKLLSSSVPTASDNEIFWNEDAGEGKSYGTLLSEACEQYIKEVLVAVYLYDSYSSLSSSERRAISSACREVLDYKANGDKSRFNEQASAFGFTYSDFEEATEILYKSYKAKTAIYGSDGSNLKNYPELCNEYLEDAFSHVRLLFIRTETKFVLDQNGNRVVGEDGCDLTEPLSEEEKAERLLAISELDAAILGKETDADMQISPQMFSLYQEKYGEGDSEKDESGYYFAPEADYTKEFKSAFAAVVDTALSMEVDTYKKIKTDEGYCYVYRLETESGAYTVDSYGFFSDFYSDCAAFSYSDSLATLSLSVKVSEDYAPDAVISTPYNSDLIAYITE